MKYTVTMKEHGDTRICYTTYNSSNVLVFLRFGQLFGRHIFVKTVRK